MKSEQEIRAAVALLHEGLRYVRSTADRESFEALASAKAALGWVLDDELCAEAIEELLAGARWARDERNKSRLN